MAIPNRSSHSIQRIVSFAKAFDLVHVRSAPDFVEPEPVARLVAVRARLVKVSGTIT